MNQQSRLPVRLLQMNSWYRRIVSVSRLAIHGRGAGRGRSKPQGKKGLAGRCLINPGAMIAVASGSVAGSSAMQPLGPVAGLVESVLASPLGRGREPGGLLFLGGLGSGESVGSGA
jgi:hypothetical protein